MEGSEMNKMIAAIAVATLSIGVSLSGAPANAATGSQASSDVSAYYRVDLGYMVGWKAPVDRSGITGYVVTATPGGQTCAVSGATANSCTFSTKTLGYTNQYTFTVATKKGSALTSVSDASNAVSAASIALTPLAVVSKVISPTKVDVAWVPNSNTGGAPLYGYKVTYWKSDTKGSPINSTKAESIVSDVTTSLSVERGFMYIINVASCNAYGCSSADYWSYANTGATNVTLPRVISGGSASTTCFESIYDANAGETEIGTCGPVVADPSKYPVVNSSATSLNINLATKFSQRATLSLTRSYSLKTWGPIGISWFANLKATSKSVTLGFESTPVIWSTTSAVCEVVGEKILLKSVGACSISAYVNGNGVFETSNTVTQVVTVTS
jgi:titin